MFRIIAVACLMFAGVTASLLSGCSDEPSNEEAAPLIGESIRHSLEAAESYLTTGNEAHARSILAKVMEQAPDDGRGYEMMGRLELRRGIELRELGLIDSAREQFRDSFLWYEKALRFMEKSGGLCQSAGEVAQLAGLDEKALSLYMSAMELEPDNPKPSLCAAQLLLDTQPDRAESILRSVLDAHPDQSHALASLALACQAQGRDEVAAELASKALAIAGDQVAVRIVIARVHRLSGREREALELLLALPDEVRSQESAASEIALCWHSLGQPLNAGEAWADCFRANAYRADAWRFALRAAEAMADADRESMAASWLEQAVMLDAPDIEVEQTRSRIAKSGLFED
ncbi:MAG: hypothetical protein CMJ40_10015 [Phycisphaerae bacterium]|nr:hypothetical protein [Phycisphaerae bacterium]